MENAMQPLLPPPPPPAFDMPRSSTEQTVTHELIFGTSIVFSAAIRNPGPVEADRASGGANRELAFGTTAGCPRRVSALDRPGLNPANLSMSLSLSEYTLRNLPPLTRAAFAPRPWDDRESVGRRALPTETFSTCGAAPSNVAPTLTARATA